MARNPRELVIETILESYRQEHRILADGAPAIDAGMFTELFEPAHGDGKLDAHVDVTHLTYLASTLVCEGARHWAAGTFDGRSFAEVVAADIVTLIEGFHHRTKHS